MYENPYSSPGAGSGMPQQKKGPRIWVGVLIVLGIGTLLVFLFMPVTRSAGPATRRISCLNNLRQIALALRNYESTYHAFPPAYTVDAQGKPLHSWRTLILPYLEERQLYDTIDLSKPWDDPANAKACQTILQIYSCPADSSPPNYTTYMASVGPNACFKPTEPRLLAEINDPSQTLMLIEAPSDKAVPWMAPQDADEQLVLNIRLDSKLAHAGGTNAVYVDSHSEFLDLDSSAADRRAMISVTGHHKPGEGKAGGGK